MSVGLHWRLYQGEQGWEKLQIRAFMIAFSGIILFPSSAGRIDFRCSPPGGQPERGPLYRPSLSE